MNKPPIPAPPASDKKTIPKPAAASVKVSPEVARAVLASAPELRDGGLDTNLLVERASGAEVRAKTSGVSAEAASANARLGGDFKALQQQLDSAEKRIVTEIARLHHERETLRAAARDKVEALLAQHDPTRSNPFTQRLLEGGQSFLERIGFR